MTVRIEPLGEADRSRYEAVLAGLCSDEQTEQQVTFFHTWEWGQVLAQRTARLQRVAVVRDDDVIAVGQLALHHDHRIAYWYAPRGLAMDYTDTIAVTQAYEALREYCRKLGARAAFLRVDPNVVQGDAAQTALEGLGARKAAVFHQVERCWITELHASEEEQLAYMKAHGMRTDVLRRVKKSRKSGVTVRASDDPADLEKLIQMLHSLDERKGGIGMHPDEHYRTQFAQLAPAGHQVVFLAELDGRVAAANLMAVYGGEASWLHGATSTEPDLRKLSGAYQLHLETMRWLAEHRPEVRRYNFWGIVSEENYHEGHPRYGYSHFKRSFGGEKVEYIRAREFAYRPIERSLLYAADAYRTRKYSND